MSNNSCAVNQHDCPRWSKDYQRLTEQDHLIPCLGAFGHCNRQNNDPPLKNHYHLNCMEVHVMLKGTQIFYVDGKRYKLAGDQIFLTLPNVPHSSDNEPQLRAEFYYFQLNLIDHKKILGLDTQHTRYLIKRLNSIEGHVFHGGSTINSLIASSFRNLSTKDENLRYCAQAQIVSFLHMLCHIATLPDITYRTPFADGACKYISEHLYESISLEKMASEFGYSLSRFKTKFRAEVGLTPMHYINREKIEVAKELLLSGTSITSVAMQLGFNSSNYFSTVFRRFTSVSPSRFQQENLRSTQE